MCPPWGLCRSPPPLVPPLPIRITHTVTAPAYVRFGHSARRKNRGRGEKGEISVAQTVGAVPLGALRNPLLRIRLPPVPPRQRDSHKISSPSSANTSPPPSLLHRAAYIHLRAFHTVASVSGGRLRLRALVLLTLPSHVRPFGPRHLPPPSLPHLSQDAAPPSVHTELSAGWRRAR